MTEAALKLLREEQIKKPDPFTKPAWWDEVETSGFMRRYTKKKLMANYRQAVKDFLTGELTRRYHVKSNNGNHIFYAKNEGQELWLFKNNPSIKTSMCIAKKFNGVYIGNSSSLARLRTPNGRLVAAGGGRFKIQEVLEDCMMMLPFQMFKETKLDINSLEMIERGPSETVEVKDRASVRVIDRHFMGAMVFKINAQPRSSELHYQGKGQYFLFDIDRNDLKLKNMNFFLSRLDRPVTSIQDAYASLKPKEVYDAERFLGKPCERQGEWFFIPVQGEFAEKREHGTGQRGIGSPVEALLQSKGNRAHYVKYLSEEGYVKGRVRHGGFEHEPIELETWCKPVPNTAVESFKISGAID